MKRTLVLVILSLAFGQFEPLAFAQLEPLDRAERIAPGVELRERRFVRGEEGPFTIQVLTLDPSNPAVNLVAVHAKDAATGLETVPELADRYGAVAAVNGGYFEMRGAYRGAAAGNLVEAGEVLGSGRSRSGLVICKDQGGRDRIGIAMTQFEGEIRAGKLRMPLLGVNRQRAASDAVLYTPALGERTGTAGGLEVVVQRERVADIRREGDSAIPRDGYVLSGSGAAGEDLAKLRRGDRVQVRAKVQQDACEAEAIVGGGPKLIRGGRLDFNEPGFAHAKVRHPRTAAGRTQDGRILLVTVDGRQKSSVGMTIEELANLLLELGAVEAVNLDGGGSTTLVAGGRVRNSPSDGRPRPVSDALLVFSIPDREALERLTRKYAALPANTTRRRILAEAKASLR
jgi:exopolysaccharide biosynthesis protein